MWPNSQFAADLIIISEEILNGKLYFFVPCSSDLEEQLIWKYPQKNALMKSRFSKAANCSTRASNFYLNIKVFTILDFAFSLVSITGVISIFII